MESDILHKNKGHPKGRAVRIAAGSIENIPTSPILKKRAPINCISTNPHIINSSRSYDVERAIPPIKIPRAAIAAVCAANPENARAEDILKDDFFAFENVETAKLEKYKTAANAVNIAVVI